MSGLIALFVFLLAAGLTRYLSHPDARLRILDQPNERSLHLTPVPRTGGLAICAGIFSGLLLITFATSADRALSWIMAGTVLIAVVSFLDDRFSLSVKVRLFFHCAAAVLLLPGGLAPAYFELPGLGWRWDPWLSAILTVLFVVWMTNLYNFMDGMDGFAGGMAVFGFGTFAILGVLADKQLFYIANIVVAVSSAGFLWFNFPPAKIFMGDAGASTLGFVAAGCTLWAARDGIFPLWVGFLVFSPFIVDATVTVLRRQFSGEKVWEAHRTHYYQRLVQLGWGHRRTVLAEYLLMAAVAGSAIGVRDLHAGGQWLVLGAWMLTYLCLMSAVHIVERRAR